MVCMMAVKGMGQRTDTELPQRKAMYYTGPIGMNWLSETHVI